jgi:hypothetical protein
LQVILWPIYSSYKTNKKIIALKEMLSFAFKFQGRNSAVWFRELK